MIANAYNVLFQSALVVLAVLTLLCLIRAIQGPRIADRIVSINMISTLTIAMIGILAIRQNQGYLVDVALIYALIGFARCTWASRWKPANRSRRRAKRMLDWIRFGLTAVLVIAGLFLMASGVLGQFRLKYVLNRMHAAGMGDSLGLPLVFIGLCISAPDWVTVMKLVLVFAFIWITSPTGSHLIARLELTSNEHPENEMEVVQK